MKRIMNFGPKMAMLLVAMLTGNYTFAQDDPSVYDTPVKHDYWQFIGPAILLLLIVYVGYRYWHDNYSHDDKHTPHHP